MRLPKEVVEKRNLFVFNLFKNNPKLTIAQTQEALKAEFGKVMSPANIAKLKKSAMGGGELVLPAPTPRVRPQTVPELGEDVEAAGSIPVNMDGIETAPKLEVLKDEATGKVKVSLDSESFLVD